MAGVPVDGVAPMIDTTSSTSSLSSLPVTFPTYTEFTRPSICTSLPLIFKLNYRSRVSVIVTAILGNGVMHAKFMPSTTAAFNYVPIVELAPTFRKNWTSDEKTKLVQLCPGKVFVVKNEAKNNRHMSDTKHYTNTPDTKLPMVTDTFGLQTDTKVPMVTDTKVPIPINAHLPAAVSTNIRVRAERCILCQECVNFAAKIKKSDDIILDTKKDEFIFNIESNGSRTPQDIVLQGINILKNDLLLLVSELSKLVSSSI